MKRLFFAAFLGLIASVSVKAQIAHDLEIYSEDGLKFTLIINGVTINETPQSNVKVLDTHNDYVLAVLKFEDGSIETIKRKNLQLADPAYANSPVSVVYKVVEKKGKYKLRFVSRSDKKIQYR